MKKRAPVAVKKQPVALRRKNAGHGDLVGSIGALLEAARRSAARAVNVIMTGTYWEIGRRIVEFEQAGRTRADYGEALIERLAADLSARFGAGFSARNVWQMKAFYLAWPILPTPSAESGRALIPQTPSADSIAGLASRFPLPWRRAAVRKTTRKKK